MTIFFFIFQRNKSWHFMWILCQFTWKVKTCFLWKIKKKFLNVVCYIFCLELKGLISKGWHFKQVIHQILGIQVFLFLQKTIHCGTHLMHLSERLLMNTHNIVENKKNIYLVTAHVPISAQSSNLIFRLLPVFFYLLLYKNIRCW